tara:strand:+ start:257 stop:1738 length:1482 start_codon:yes stop_codon:yes gene_type:complete
MILRNNLIKELGLPNSIAEFVTPENFHKNESEGYDYDAYQYRFDLIQSTTVGKENIPVPEGKYMIGAHKGVFDLSYYTSCASKEFRTIFQGDTPCLRLTVYNLIKDQDAWLKVKQAEHIELTEKKAASDDMSWNGNNGFPAYPRIRRDICDPFIKQLNSKMAFNDGAYDVGYESLNIHKDMESRQVRGSWSSEFVNNITIEVDDNGGNIENTDRVVVWEGRGIFGNDVRGDGNQTVSGVANTKSGKAGTAQVKVARIPFEINQHLTDLEIDHIGNCLNKRPKKKFRPVDVPDGGKIILELVKSGADMKTPEHDKILKDDYGLNSKQRENVYKFVVDTLHKESESIANRVYADYSLPHLAPFKTRKLDALRTDVTKLVIPVTVGIAFKWLDMIATAIRDAMDLSEIDEETGKPVNLKYYYKDDRGKLVFGVKSVQLLLDYKQSYAARSQFRKEFWPDFEDKFKALGSNIILEDYEEMDLTVPSTLTALEEENED